jgi:hypothetical protein
MKKLVLEGRKLRVYKFDWDDNILNLPTKIKMYKSNKPVYVSTSEFAELRNNSKYEVRNDAFEEFRDYGKRGEDAFIQDTKKAIENNKQAPSFKKFKEALKYANYFAIITARGHAPATLKRGVRTFIDTALNPDEKIVFKRNLKKLYGDLPFNDLIEKYLSEQRYYPVSSPEFQKQFGSMVGAEEPELAKQIASRDFIDYIEGVAKSLDAKDIRIKNPKSKGKLEISVGFSDDDKKNVEAMEEFMKSLKKEKPDMTFVIYDTSNPKDVKKIVIERLMKESKDVSEYKVIPDIHREIKKIIEEAGLVYDDYEESFVKYAEHNEDDYEGYYEIKISLDSPRYAGDITPEQYLRVEEKLKRLVGVDYVDADTNKRRITISMIDEYPDMFI